eukprot:TRINITY_DN35465_c0_g1_i1.p3 TRINITY_DN35465_c0_g1~~TRINITY_DN35465_c0_g1_i1.p3  ORF type:complete len:122 (+),score=13.09 TRINITY_DN35465_c0_g1_i1:271-636(+)
MGTRQLAKDTAFLNWLQTAEDVKLKVSVCTGSLLLGAAGFLKDKRATTHFAQYEALAPYVKEVCTQQTIVEDTGVITGGAVAASIDVGLYLVEKLVGPEARTAVVKRMGLPTGYNTGNLEK